jgi:hypothetical protein
MLKKYSKKDSVPKRKMPSPKLKVIKRYGFSSSLRTQKSPIPDNKKQRAVLNFMVGLSGTICKTHRI